jgi:hypothetical protein
LPSPSSFLTTSSARLRVAMPSLPQPAPSLLDGALLVISLKHVVIYYKRA